MADTATVRLALAACACTHAGKAAAGSTQRYERSAFYNALAIGLSGPPVVRSLTGCRLRFSARA